MQMIFVNLPVTDLNRAMAFYTAIGCQNVPQFTDETAACMQYSDAIFFMILTEEKFASFCSKPIGDPAKNTSAIIALSAENRKAVDEFMDAGLGAGGSDNDQTQEYGEYMYGRSISDPDGNVLEIMWMDVEKAP